MSGTRHHGYTRNRGGGRRCTIRGGDVTEDWGSVSCPTCMAIRAERELAGQLWRQFTAARAPDHR